MNREEDCSDMLGLFVGGEGIGLLQGGNLSGKQRKAVSGDVGINWPKEEKQRPSREIERGAGGGL